MSSPVLYSFSPIAIDKEYKTGEDMLYGQGLPGAGGVQLMLVPRRDVVSHDLESRESSYAVKWRLKAQGGDVDLLVARHVDENLIGAGLVHNLGGAVWRFDVPHMNLAAGDAEFSLVTNLDYSWVWGGKNFYGYAEYFRSGIGEKDGRRYLAPNAALGARLARGEL